MDLRRSVNTRLYLYGYNSQATKPPYKLQGFSIGAKKQDVLYVSLISGSTTGTYAALISPDGSTSPADSVYTDVTVQSFTLATQIIHYSSQLNLDVGM